MTPDPTEKLPAGRRWLRVALAVSLTLNLLVVGLVVGAAMRFGGPDGGHKPPPSMGAALYRELPRDDRKAVRAAMKSAHGQRKSDRATEAQRLGDALRAQPFDAAAVQAVMAVQAQARADWQGGVQQAWLARVAAMSDAERIDYANRLQKAMTRPRGDRKPRD